jgi:rubrerythrin
LVNIQLFLLILDNQLMTCGVPAEGLRVAYWYSDNNTAISHTAINDYLKIDRDGNSGQLILPNKIISAFKQVDDLKAIRDQHFNEAKAIFQEWLIDASDSGWLEEATKNLTQWRGHGRLVTLIYKWRMNRVPGDEMILDTLEEWLNREKHLYDWESNLRDKAVRYRREIYRVFASEIAVRYENVIFEDFNLSKLAKKPVPEKGTRGAIQPDYQRTIAAVSTLRLAVENACKKRRTAVLYIDPKNSTMECNNCGHTEKFDAASHLIRTCPACNEVWDQDLNAGKILFQRGEMQISKIV